MTGQRQPRAWRYAAPVRHDGLTHQCRQRRARDHAAGDYGVKGESTAGNNTVEPRLVIPYAAARAQQAEATV
jgi:hypothetical protein